jgi:hypothetical protein
MEAVFWIVRKGSPWRDLPPLFGNWNAVFKRYRDGVKADVFSSIFEACSDAPDMEYAMVDATIVKVHHHGQGAKGRTPSQAIGRSNGGMTTKIPALTDALGKIWYASFSCPATASVVRWNRWIALRWAVRRATHKGSRWIAPLRCC